MAEHFKIVFEGRLHQGVDPQTARHNLAQLFGTDVAALEYLFGGAPVALKSGLTLNDAQAHQDVLRQAGLDTRLEAEQLSKPSLDKAPPVEPILSVPHPTESPYAPPSTSVTADLPRYGELKVFSIQGRIGRLRYMAWGLLLFLALILAATVCIGLFSMSRTVGGLFATVAFIGFTVVSVQLGAQRLHDAGWSAWLLLLNAVPLIGNFFPLLLMVVPGNAGPNRYGAPPPPNSRSVNVLATLSVLLIVLVVISTFSGGLQAVRETIETSATDYEQSLPYDDDRVQTPDDQDE